MLHRIAPTVGVTLALSLAPLAAQATPCESLNDSTNAVRGLFTLIPPSGFNTYAYQITAQQNLTVQSLQLFTESRFRNPPMQRFMALSIYDHDPVTSFPGARLGRGVFQIDLNRGPAWQGTNLDQPVSLTQGNTYWIGWEEPGGSQLPWDPNGTAGRAARLNPTWGNAGQIALKYRLFCSLLSEPTVILRGTACTNSMATQGTLFSNELPTIGNLAFGVEGTGFPASAGAVLMLGVDPSFVPAPLAIFPAGCMLNTDIVISVTGTTGSGPITGPTTSGHAHFPLGLPNDPTLAGKFFAAQLGVLDAGAAAIIPVVMSNGLGMLIL